MAKDLCAVLTCTEETTEPRVVHHQSTDFNFIVRLCEEHVKEFDKVFDQTELLQINEEGGEVNVRSTG